VEAAAASIAQAFALRVIGILARHVAAAGRLLVKDLKAVNNVPIQLVPVLQRLALEVIGAALFSLEMKKYGAELRHLIFSYASSLERARLCSTWCSRPRSRRLVSYVDSASDAAG